MTREVLPPTEPGQRVRHPERPDWGVGQVQSVVGSRITVNFEHAGKVLVNAAVVGLEVIDDDADRQGRA
jgi:hypothetical protein